MGLFSIFEKTKNLYFPGCRTFFKNKQACEMYKLIFSKLGIKFKVLEEYNCCGLDVYEAGYEQEARKIIKKNFETFKEKGIENIITSCPGCFKMLISYKELIPGEEIKILNIWKMILDNLIKKSHLIQFKAMESVTFHDSCYLGRYCGIYEDPRKILETIGYEIKEMDNSRENSFCCGDCGGLVRTNPKIADKIAKERLLQAKRIGVNKMIVCSFSEYDILKKNSTKTGIEVFEISQLLGKALGLSVDDFSEDSEENIENEEHIFSDEGRNNLGNI